MKYGVIDIGSNTIRLVVYKVTGGRMEYLLNEKYFVQLIAYIKNGELSKTAVQSLLTVLSSLKGLAAHHDLKELCCFATAPFRALSDPQAIVDLIRERIGLHVVQLTGEEEARYGVIGARYDHDILQGLFVDLGGGSMETTIVRDGAIQKSESIDIGSVSLSHKFVSDIFPTEKELAKIKNHIDKRLEEISWIREAADMDMYLMGGTARSMGQVHAEIHASDVDLEHYSFLCNEIKTLYKKVWEMETEGIRLLSKICPGRIFTFVPGVLLLSKTAQMAKTVRVHFSLHGVREGYLLERVLVKHEHSPIKAG
jgi:exopolyphosphatase/guanosine-5'-triphosphate,3'-diphosphate pyrophosphatase